MAQIKQGDIYLADLNPVKGHEQGGFRPVLVLQNDILNANLNTVIIAPITKNLSAKGYLTTFFLNKKISRLTHDSVALLYQIRTLDKERLKKPVSSLGAALFKDIKKQLFLVF
jgi:mRNA interferase MazF